MAYTFKHGDRPIDGYTIQRAVGKGGFGEVYYAISDGGREVALKYLRDNPQVELRGVSHCINLKSPHLVAIFDVKKTTDGEYGIIMEYCSGPSLRDLLIAEPNGFGPQKAAFFVREIAKGLAYLHDRGIVHRDLKPGNIFYDDGYVKIGDYGLSKFISVSRHSVQTASVGTVHYMAPEIGSGNYSRGVDIYALGVMLYEMLLGKVPFEGSTMAEVLMKHLTAQPELEQLPHPFGKVIRKALEKDPNDRYQSVDEMVEDLLAVDEVRESVAGFRPQSLDGAVRHAGRGAHDSPVPSPNPAPGFAGDFAEPPYAEPIGHGPLPRRVAKRMNKLSRKIDARIAKLQGRAGRRQGGGVRVPPRRDTPPPAPPAFMQADRRKRIVLSGLLSVGLAVGLGVLVGNTSGRDGDEWGATAGMMVIAMSGAVLLARAAVHWFGVSYGPTWSIRLVQLCCATPMLAIASAPLLGSSHSSSAGVAIWLSLLFVAVFANWERTITNASGGEMRFGAAVGRALFALVAAAIAAGMFGASPEERVIFVAAGVAGAVTLILQATAWWLPAKTDRALQRFRSMPGRNDEFGEDRMGDVPPPPPGHDRLARTRSARTQKDSAGDAISPAEPTDMDRALQRWGVTRAFWGLVSFALLGGTIVTFVLTLIGQSLSYHDRTAAVVGCTACFSMMLFALRKTSPMRRPGFWRESLRPWLLSAMLFAIGGTITGIAREWSHHGDCPSLHMQIATAGVVTERFVQETCRACVSDGGRAALVSGLVMSSLALLGLTFFTGRKPAPPRPFVTGVDDDAAEDGSSSGPETSSLPHVEGDHTLRAVERDVT